MSLIPSPTKKLDLKVGVVRDDYKVAVAMGDLLAHLTVEEAEQIGQGLIECARSVRFLRDTPLPGKK